MKTIYTAHSKHNHYAKHFVSAYVLAEGMLPLNPFMNWGYFLDDLVERETIYKANQQLIELSDEVWQFGAISNGCYRELVMAMGRKMPIKFFTIGGKTAEIQPITDLNNLVFESELMRELDTTDFQKKLEKYLR